MVDRKAASFLATATVAVACFAVERVVVAGESMRPALEPGDRLLVLRWPRLKPGHVVALRDPSQRDRTLVKRVRHLDGDLVEVRGDNDAASTDSRQFGAVSRRFVRGRVIYRYFPAARVGWIS